MANANQSRVSEQSMSKERVWEQGVFEGPSWLWLGTDGFLHLMLRGSHQTIAARSVGGKKTHLRKVSV